MKKYGLIGYPLSHSFSEKYFTRKFREENVPGCSYHNFPIRDIREVNDLLKREPLLAGLNVTIPYKEAVIPYLDILSEEAMEIGAVNTIRLTKDKREGFNTDGYGFLQAINPLLKPHHTKALILGSGGASKAVAFALKQRSISFQVVSRTPEPGKKIGYAQITPELLTGSTIVINTTPLGMYPDTGSFPPIPYEAVTSGHLFFDLVYNPSESLFLQKGRERGAVTANGYQMLISQAEKSWEIWNH